MDMTTTKNVGNRFEELDEVGRTALSAIMYNIMFVNDLAVGAICDAFEQIDNAGLAKHRVKHWMTITRTHIRDYNKKLDKKSGGFIEFLADLYDQFESENELDLYKLRNSIMLVLDKRRVSHSRVVAELYMAMTFTLGAINNVEHCMDGFPEYKHFKKFFNWLELRDIKASFSSVAKELGKVLKDDDVLNILDADMNVQNGFKVIAQRVSDADKIVEVCNRHASAWDEEIEEG